MYLDELDTPHVRPEPGPPQSCGRRGFLTAALAGGALSLPLVGVAAPASAAAVRGRVYTVGKRDTALNKKYPRAEFRGMWVASVLNVDWPSKPGLPVAAQKAELRALLDLAVKRRLNTVLLQVRPSADRMWVSTLGEPWSKYLSGTQGKDPGYDPLAHAVAEAHRRALSLHAWINPYRVSMGTSLNSLVSTHPARKNPSWTFAHGGKRYYNPGIPAVRNYIISVIKDLVKRYDVDGIHFDDYFYPYPVSGVDIPDGETYKKYKGSYTSVADWRRNNVNVFVRDVHKAIHAAKPRVVFGISPFGIWRNRSSSTLGSATKGLEAYTSLYADSRAWVKNNWVDYMLPQLYWNQGFTVADYNVLVDWWAKQVAGTKVKLMIGEATYRVGAGGAWNDKNELRDHLTKTRSVPAVRGQAFYNATSVRANPLNAMGALAAAHYTRPALPLPLPNLRSTRPKTPAITSAVRTASGVKLSWKSSASGERIRFIAIWRWESTGSKMPNIQATGKNLRKVAARTATAQSWTDTGVVRGKRYWYMIQAISQTGMDSAKASAIFVKA
ncbi:glycoside hydrolase family 10 protein [Paeniglutamicibacter kerguelensis]|uniref:Uncharacterized lipoprotein YddW (UPF0748 family) n=1 Tax=Paeniglutamicibacter kerguelensis TaxID=254788 RepID=A0ABS4XEU4_9MICC|nr:family 10 glycosylhydrolase [Paeniglutamicibacter kerguelensis]MBP2386831.1 uncharacterized lipoprotein YddW (UPF0748 family) [Paeniglutamicibacter kerguelensis]